MSKLVRSVLPQFKRSDLKDSFCIIPYSFKKLEWEKNLITTLAKGEKITYILTFFTYTDKSLICS